MTRGSRALCALYLATAVWLAWCTVNGWGHEHPSISVLNAAASVIAVVAIVRETVLADERHMIAFLVQRAVRREATAEPLPADGEPLDDSERAAWQEIATHWDDRSAA